MREHHQVCYYRLSIFWQLQRWEQKSVHRIFNMKTRHLHSRQSVCLLRQTFATYFLVIMLLLFVLFALTRFSSSNHIYSGAAAACPSVLLFRSPCFLSLFWILRLVYSFVYVVSLHPCWGLFRCAGRLRLLCWFRLWIRLLRLSCSILRFRSSARAAIMAGLGPSGAKTWPGSVQGAKTVWTRRAMDEPSW